LFLRFKLPRFGVFALLLLAGCGINRDTTPPNLVYAGPLELRLHEDFNPKSKVVVVVHHGDRLEVVAQRRRLYRLKTAKGILGWTDERNLMSVDQMQALSKLEETARRMPGQGVAISYDPLNVHTEPQRFSPSFIQIKPGAKFDVIAHQISSRAEPKHRVLVKPQPRPESQKKRADKKRVPPPPPPAAPKPPDDWTELSENRPPSKPPKPEKTAEPPEPAPTDDWTLVRTSSGAAGWVLTNRIYLAIPDEVAQYAEGHRITTYFSLGKIHDTDRDQDKDIWLWTTIHAGEHPFDYDSFRVFTWNPKRHRYETAYIARSVEGFLPVLVNKSTAGQVTFSVCLTQNDGSRLRRDFVLIDRQIKGAGAEACKPAETIATGSTPSNPMAAPGAGTGEPSKSKSFSSKLGEIKKKLLGH
jgi:hypothetical protein